jgi:hypothetical protein
MSEDNKKPFRGWGILIAAIFIAGMVAVALLNLPKGIDMDLDKIGDGKPALVFVYDANLSVSGMQTETINRIRSDFEQVHFLVADIGRPQAQAWLQLHQARPAELFFIDAQGTVRQRQHAPLTAEDLAAAIRTYLEAPQ